MTLWAFAGSYSQDVVNAAGVPMVNQEVYVYLTGTDTLATLYTDNTKVATAPNPVSTDAYGNLLFFADPGPYYDIAIAGGNRVTVQVGVDPSDLSGEGLKTYTSGLAPGSVAGTLTVAQALADQAAGWTGWYLDPRFIWNLSDNFVGISNFAIVSHMRGSIGYSQLVAYGPGYIDTGSGYDGVTIYGNASNPTQGLLFEGLAFVGANPNAVVHVGGGQRSCSLQNCFVANTVAGASVAIASATNSGTTITVDLAAATTLAVNQTIVVAGAAGGTWSAIDGVWNVASVISSTSYTFDVGTAPTGTYTASSATIVGQSFALVDDTGLSTENGEDEFFSNVQLVNTSTSPGAPCLGIGVDTLATQRPNDTLWAQLTTLTQGGQYSVIAANGGNHQFQNYYDRSGSYPTIATVLNVGSQMHFFGGEDYCESATGLDHMLSGGSAMTCLMNRTLTAPAGGTSVVVSNSGNFIARGRCTLNGTVALSSGGTLDIADSALSPGSLTVTGASGTLLLVASAYYTGGSPNTSGFTGTKTTLGAAPPAWAFADRTTGTSSQPGTWTRYTTSTGNLTSSTPNPPAAGQAPYVVELAASGGGGVILKTNASDLTSTITCNGVVYANGSSALVLTIPGQIATFNYDATDTTYIVTIAGPQTQTVTAPPASTAATVALGTAFHNTLGYDAIVQVVLNITANSSLVISAGIGPTATPTQQTLVTGVTSLGLVPLSFYVPSGYYMLLSDSGTGTVAVVAAQAQAT